MSDSTYILCTLIGINVLAAAFALWVARLADRNPRRTCPRCASAMRKRAIMDGHVWQCGVCGRVRVAGPGV